METIGSGGQCARCGQAEAGPETVRGPRVGEGGAL